MRFHHSQVVWIILGWNAGVMRVFGLAKATRVAQRGCPRTIMQGWFRALLLLFFITHIPITIFIDAQVVFPREWFPQIAQDLFNFHTTTNKDFLFRDCRTEYPYVRWIGVCEVFFQLPFFFVAIYGLIHKKEWLRIPAIVYSTHVPTTVIPAVADFLQNPNAPPLEDGIKLSLLYGIYFLIPTLWLIQLLSSSTIWTNESQAPKAKKN